VNFAVILDLFVAPEIDLCTVLQLETIDGVLQVIAFHKDALEGLRVETERGAPLETLLVGIKVDVFELVVRKIRRDVRCL